MSTKHAEERLDEIAHGCLNVRLRLLDRVVTSLYDDALRPLGLKVTQLAILVAAARLRLARPAVICGLLLMDTSTLSRNVERMRAKGWLEIVPDEDGRAHPFRVTPRGARLVREALPRWRKAQAATRRIIGPTLEKELLRVVEEVRSGRGVSP